MTIVIFFIVLFVLILVHEFGHYIVAKKSGIRVDEFGIGFPPKAWGKQIGETEYTLNWLPIGGFVRIFGEDPTQEHYDDKGMERSFVNKPWYIQSAVLVAGVTMNVLLAFVLFVVAYMIGMPTAVDSVADLRNPDQPLQLLVTSVVPDSPASVSLLPNDEIVAVRRGDDTLPTALVASTSAVSAFIGAEAGEEVLVDVIRRNEQLTVTMVPEAGVDQENPDRVLAGFTMALVGIEQLPLLEAVTTSASRTYHDLIAIAVGLGGFVKDAVTGNADLAQVAGPVGIVNMVGDAAALGVTWLLTFTAFISLNLAVINILPIPALDGGRLVFVLYEAVTRQTVKPAFANRVNQVGFIVLLGLMLLITISDVVKLF